METREREMVRKLDVTEHPQPDGKAERFTSLQPTYEDTIPPSEEEDWLIEYD